MHQFLEGVQGLPVAHFLQDPDTLRIVHPPPTRLVNSSRGGQVNGQMGAQAEHWTQG